MADRLLISPFWAMWLPNLIFLITGGWLLVLQVKGRRSLAIATGGFNLNPLELARKVFKSRQASLAKRKKEI